MSCGQWRDSVAFPGKREAHEYVGEIHDAWGNGELVGEAIKDMHKVTNCEDDLEKR